MTSSTKDDTSALPARPSDRFLQFLCKRDHSGCFSSRSVETGGLGLNYKVDGEGVTTEWTCPKDKESYAGIVHGGILATVMDSAMLNTLFAYGIVAKTGRMDIRYKLSVASGMPMEIKAFVREYRHPLYATEASISQGGKVCVTATAKFMATGRITVEDVEKAENA